MTHYETLDIPREASAEQIKRSHRRLVKLYHPDKFPSGSAKHTESEKRIRDINQAYSGFPSQPVEPATTLNSSGHCCTRKWIWSTVPDAGNQQATGTHKKGRLGATRALEGNIIAFWRKTGCLTRFLHLHTVKLSSEP